MSDMSKAGEIQLLLLSRLLQEELGASSYNAIILQTLKADRFGAEEATQRLPQSCTRTDPDWYDLIHVLCSPTSRESQV